MTRALLVAEGAHELSGALEELVAKLTGLRFDVSCKQIRDIEVRVHIPRGRFPGFSRRFLGWISYAQEQQFDVLIAIIDEDGEPRRHAEIDEAQANQDFELRHAFGVAVQAFDAWMLADEKALSRVLKTNIAKVGSPERLKDPKSHFLNLRDKCGVTESVRELYKRIAEEVDAALLVSACPTGFQPFADRVRHLFPPAS